jgi:serine/threonine protein kinase
MTETKRPAELQRASSETLDLYKLDNQDREVLLRCQIALLDQQHIRLNRYLGAGKFGAVFECQETGDGKEKKALKLFLSGDDSLTNAQHEATVWRSLQTAGSMPASLVQFERIINIDAGNGSSHTGLLFELCNRDLAAEVAERQQTVLHAKGRIQVQDTCYFTPCEVIDIADQLYNGLFFLHTHNWVHCDLAMRNVLLRGPDDGTWPSYKIADLGIAAALDEKGKSSAKPLNNSPMPTGEKVTSKCGTV